MLQRYIIDARTIIYDIDLNYTRSIFVRVVSVVFSTIVLLAVSATSTLRCWSLGVRTASRPDSLTELYRSEQTSSAVAAADATAMVFIRDVSCPYHLCLRWPFLPF